MNMKVFAAVFLAAFSIASVAAGSGAICLTFDDRNFGAWERCMPLFKRYGAHATFFVCGPIDARAQLCMETLAKEGHSVGLHGCKHRKVTDTIAKLGEEGYVKDEILPQLSVCREKGIPARSFAYPMSARNAATDAVLLKHFSRLRGGYGKIGNKSWGDARGPVPMPDVATNRVMMGLCGTNPRDMPDRIAAMLPSLAASNLVLTVYAHNIEAPGAKHDNHNITEEDLEKILSAAKSAGVAVLGFDDLK
jgi:peptidoglycan/xylan/chitin deacetylase (PgdA/CDA1 family)